MYVLHVVYSVSVDKFVFFVNVSFVYVLPVYYSNSLRTEIGILMRSLSFSNLKKLCILFWVKRDLWTVLLTHNVLVMQREFLHCTF